jgi:hypothetical protein
MSNEPSNTSMRVNSDQRVTRFIDWVLAAIGAGLILMMWRAGDTLIDLKVAVATLTVRVDGKDQRDDLQDKRLDTLEQKNFRGVDGYADRSVDRSPKEEPRRGH